MVRNSIVDSNYVIVKSEHFLLVLHIVLPIAMQSTLSHTMQMQIAVDKYARSARIHFCSFFFFFFFLFQTYFKKIAIPIRSKASRRSTKSIDRTSNKHKQKNERVRLVGHRFRWRSQRLPFAAIIVGDYGQHVLDFSHQLCTRDITKFRTARQHAYAGVFANIGDEYADGALHFRHLHLAVDGAYGALEREREDVLAKHRVRGRNIKIAPVVVVVLHVDKRRARLVVDDRVARLVELRWKANLHCRLITVRVFATKNSIKFTDFHAHLIATAAALPQHLPTSAAAIELQATHAFVGEAGDEHGV
jgi:hypothetical protein